MYASIIEQEILDNEFKQKKYIFAYFTATWCGPCKMVAPIFERLAETSQTKAYENVGFVKIDIDDGDEIARKYNIRSVPTFILFVDGTEKQRTTGLQSIDKLKEIIDKNI